MEYPTEKKQEFHILSLPVDNGACGWMRIRAPFNKFKKLKIAEAEVMDETRIEESDFKKILSKADVIIARPGAAKLMHTVKDIFPYKKIIVDFDDDVFNIQPSSEHYQHYGTEDVIVNVKGKEVALWKDGFSGFWKFDNMKRLVDLQWMMEKADHITAVTERLGKHLGELIGHKTPITVIPNATDFDLYPDVEVVKKDDKFRIGYCGGGSHSGDLQMIKDEMLKVLKNTPNAELHLIGSKFEHFDSAGEQVVKHDWLPFQANPLRMKLLNLDSLIAPLEDTLFNIRKDPLKFWDSAGLKVPLLASNIPPFSDVIVDGENGLLFSSPGEFGKKIVKLIKDRELGKRLGQKSYDEVHETHNLEKLAPDVIEFYKEVWKQKKS